jgi:hypothetical protein
MMDNNPRAISINTSTSMIISIIILIIHMITIITITKAIITMRTRATTMSTLMFTNTLMKNNLNSDPTKKRGQASICFKISETD